MKIVHYYNSDYGFVACSFAKFNGIENKSDAPLLKNSGETAVIYVKYDEGFEDDTVEFHDFHAAKYGSAKPEEGSWFILKKTGIEAAIIPSSTRRFRMFNPLAPCVNYCASKKGWVKVATEDVKTCSDALVNVEL